MKVPFLEKVGYSLGDGAANLVFQLMMMFQLMFYTDVLGIGAGAAGLVLLGARVFDAFVDPLAGILSDRTSTKWGKYRPWVVGTAVPFALVFALSYLSPDWGVRAKTAWAAGTYALLMALYSFNNTPYSSLGGVMTDDGRERTSVATVRFVAATVATIVVQVATLPMVKMFEDPRTGWSVTVGIYAVFASKDDDEGESMAARLADALAPIRVVRLGGGEVAVAQDDAGKGLKGDCGYVVCRVMPKGNESARVFALARGFKTAGFSWVASLKHCTWFDSRADAEYAILLASPSQSAKMMYVSEICLRT